MYNIFDLISRYIPLIECLKMESRKGLLIAILSRFLLIPAFYFTAKYGDQGWMILLVSFLGLTNGYLTVCVLTLAPRGYKVSSHLKFSQFTREHIDSSSGVTSFTVSHLTTNCRPFDLQRRLAVSLKKKLHHQPSDRAIIRLTLKSAASVLEPIGPHSRF